MNTRSKKRIKYDEEEEKPLYIHTKTSEWTEHDQASFSIFIDDAANEKDIVEQIDNLDDVYGRLILPGWDRGKFLTFEHTHHPHPSHDRQIMTIIGKISDIVLAEKAKSTHENIVDSFMASLLSFLQFDYYPLSIHPQYDYQVRFMNDKHRISSVVEFMILKSHTNGRHAILFVEDKHTANVSAMRNWEEPQIAGEIFGSAHHNGSLKYPFDIFAVRVVGTRFTFYRAIVHEEYLKECVTQGLPKNNVLMIKRYPKDADPYKAWDLCVEDDRIKILTMLRSIEHKSINMEF